MDWNLIALFGLAITTMVGVVLWDVRKEKPSRVIELAFAGVVMLATVVNVCVALSQWQAMKENNAIARDAYTGVQRAFVTVSSFETSLQAGLGATDKTNYWWFVPVLKNSGNTPTKNLRYLVSATCPPELDIGLGAGLHLSCNFMGPQQPFDPQELAESPLAKQIGLRRALLGPQSTIAISGVGMTEKSLRRLSEGFPMFELGIIYYEDTLTGAKHITKFCFQLTARFTDKGEPQATYSQCPHWNCTDEECELDRAEYDREVAEGKFKPQLRPDTAKN